MTSVTPKRGSAHWRAWLALAIMTPIALTVYSIIEFLSRPSVVTWAYVVGFLFVSLANLDIYYNSGKRRMPYSVRVFHALEAAHHKIRYNPDLDGVTDHDEKA